VDQVTKATKEKISSLYFVLFYCLVWAIPFFISFELIGRFIMMNLFILVILNDFEEYHLRIDSPVEKF